MIEIPEKKIHHFPRYLTILFLPLAFYIVLFLGYLDLIPLKVEMHSIIINLIILLVFMMFIIHNAWYAFSFFRNSFFNVISEVDEYIELNELVIAGKKKSVGNIDHLFDNHLKNIRNDHFSSIAASIFPTMGILGTFVAIAISMPDFTVASEAALEKEITILLSGIGTAFYASIFGIFLSLWWIFFEKRGLSKIQKDIDSTRKHYKSMMWNKEEVEILSIFQNNVHRDRLLEKLESIATPEFIFTLDKVAHDKLNVITKLSNEHDVVEEKIIDNYKNVVDLFENSSKKQKVIIEDFEKLHTLIAKTNLLLSNTVIEQNKQSKAIKSEVYSVLSSLELVSSDLQNLGQDLIKNDVEESIKDEQR